MTTTRSANPSKTIATALQMLIDGVRPQGSNYLVVSSGHAYLQFMRNRGDTRMLAEAVSNKYLAPARQLDRRAIEILQVLGFEDPDVEVSPKQCRARCSAIAIAGGAPRRSPNHFRYFDVRRPEDVAVLARLVAAMLSCVYGDDPEKRLELKISLGVPTEATPIRVR